MTKAAHSAGTLSAASLIFHSAHAFDYSSHQTMSSSSSKKGEKVDDGGGDDQLQKAIQLSQNRFVSVSAFRNRLRVDIREYYRDGNNEHKPGRKGISLSLVEWTNLVQNIGKIGKLIKEATEDSD